MNTKTQKILIITAIVLIVLAVGAVIFIFAAPDKPSAPVHPAEETFYNDDGTVNRIMYYDNDVYQGQTDFYSDGNTDYVMFYGADTALLGSEATKKNAMGKIESFKKHEGDNLVEDDLYTYQDDCETLIQVVKKHYDKDGNLTAEKLVYAEDGTTVTDLYTYVGNKEKTHETFDKDNPYKAEN